MLTRPWRAHHHLAPVTSFDLPTVISSFFLGQSFSPSITSIRTRVCIATAAMYSGAAIETSKRITKSLITIDINNQSNYATTQFIYIYIGYIVYYIYNLHYIGI